MVFKMCIIFQHTQNNSGFQMRIISLSEALDILTCFTVKVKFDTFTTWGTNCLKYKFHWLRLVSSEMQCCNAVRSWVARHQHFRWTCSKTPLIHHMIIQQPSLSSTWEESQDWKFCQCNFSYVYCFLVFILDYLDVTNANFPSKQNTLSFYKLDPTPWWHCKQLVGHTACLVQPVVLLWVLFPLRLQQVTECSCYYNG
jgi:hypothetical protein